MCNHDWQPISGWYARYRCSHCSVVGCKFGVVTGYGSMTVEPYRCATRRGGVRCTELAVMRRNHEMRCKEHGAGRRATSARQKAASSRGADAAVVSAAAAASTAAPAASAISSVITSSIPSL